MKFTPVALLFLSTVLSLSAATTIDQSQLLFSMTSDLSSSGDSGQTFVAGVNGSLLGINLAIQASGYVTKPHGSDFILSLHSTLNGTPTKGVLVSGSFSKSLLEANKTLWVTVYFDQPYQQTAGEALAFTILELSDGGDEGYNTYGNIRDNHYLAGQSFVTYTPGKPLISRSNDFAFETVVAVPEPAVAPLMLFGVTLLVSKRRRSL